MTGLCVSALLPVLPGAGCGVRGAWGGPERQGNCRTCPYSVQYFTVMSEETLQQQAPQERLLTVAEFAKEIGKTERQVYRYIKNQRVRSLAPEETGMAGVRIAGSELEKFLAELFSKRRGSPLRPSPLRCYYIRTGDHKPPPCAQSSKTGSDFWRKCQICGIRLTIGGFRGTLNLALRELEC